MFKLLGVAVLTYVVYAIASGSVFAKSGVTGRSVSRAEEPQYFWIVVVIYGALGVALLTVF